eukprot:TRINITY_DN9696_c0_g1_i2.p1 TRINITY_DN9696_c0_g1~~TRINITY_DN9696_c0_g1_i2.p1  ORF type:complete len:259 (+),score=43.47 TRINITY_DN9696_c0_g1_i2:89-778(+)
MGCGTSEPAGEARGAPARRTSYRPAPRSDSSSDGDMPGMPTSAPDRAPVLTGRRPGSRGDAADSPAGSADGGAANGTQDPGDGTLVLWTRGRGQKGGAAMHSDPGMKVVDASPRVSDSGEPGTFPVAAPAAAPARPPPPQRAWTGELTRCDDAGPAPHSTGTAEPFSAGESAEGQSLERRNSLPAPQNPKLWQVKRKELAPLPGATILPGPSALDAMELPAVGPIRRNR